MSKLEQLIQQVRSELGTDFVTTEVVGTDGLSIINSSVIPEEDGVAASARFAMVMKLASKVSEKLKLGAVIDNLVTTDSVFILTRNLGDGSYFWGLAVNHEATLGTVRVVMNEYADQIWDAIPR
ncbi:MAG: hypothetical protein GYA17_08360 [Chloroflexi bacterium]|jgi:predicted regulator of Ras-like GTPase activity (Roadblock/LC7/MglB family)|nr:hypothetical protein [Anaerolineaceae bacterium]NMB88361.1 hypothetical protein [Chloroflexota bacterium]